jgi:hypothetical protein
MPNRLRFAFAVISLMSVCLASHDATAQDRTAPSRETSGESTNESAKMGPATGNNEGANNGVGTAGSLDHDAGTASSTVSGMKGGATGFGGGTPSRDSAAKVEGDPALGGDNNKK